MLSREELERKIEALLVRSASREDVARWARSSSPASDPVLEESRRLLAAADQEVCGESTPHAVREHDLRECLADAHGVKGDHQLQDVSGRTLGPPQT